MKKLIPLYFLLSLNTIKSDKIKLSNPTLEILDGKTLGINGNSIKNILYIVKEINLIQKGSLPQQKGSSNLKVYKFENKEYGLADLVIIENNLKNKKHPELETILKEAKQDVFNLVRPFIISIRNYKHLIVPLLEESCTLRNKMDSIMLEWLSASDNEEIIFDNKITNLNLLYTCLNDVKLFLFDLINSCPKGLEQFKKMMNERKTAESNRGNKRDS